MDKKNIGCDLKQHFVREVFPLHSGGSDSAETLRAEEVPR